MDESALRQAVIDAARAMAPLGLNVGTSGNVSARLDATTFVVTPSGIPYSATTPDMLVRMDVDGSYWGDLLPSTEWRLHAAIYRDRADAGGVVHAHSSYATALSCLRRDIPAFHYMIARAGGDTLRCAAYATFGTAELSAAMLAALKDRAACLLANHGAVALGKDVERALALMVEVEELAKQYWIATQIGAPVLLDDAEMARVRAAFASYGTQTPGAVSGLTRRP